MKCLVYCKAARVSADIMHVYSVHTSADILLFKKTTLALYQIRMIGTALLHSH